ncbi:F1/V1/A1 complex, alpha/beta subunit of ATPase [Pisolithus sp. B1]|nr:F1/V1/A1 complex, alpha/beta subunit of ATPase [Pisolithus sp. B1]
MSIQSEEELDLFKTQMHGLIVPQHLANGKVSTHLLKAVLVFFEDNPSMAGNSNKAKLIEDLQKHWRSTSPIGPLKFLYSFSLSITELGIYPAIDPLDSKSHMLNPCIVGQEYYEAATTIPKILPDYKSLQNIIAILGMDEFPGEDKLTVKCTCKIQQFMSQSFQVAQVFTGYEGKLIQLKDTVQSFKDSLSGAHNNLLKLLPTWLVQLRAKAEQLGKEMCGGWKCCWLKIPNMTFLVLFVTLTEMWVTLQVVNMVIGSGKLLLCGKILFSILLGQIPKTLEFPKP